VSLAVFTAVLVCGCQTVGVGPSDEEIVSTTMAEWKAVLVAKDLDKLMAAYSEDYVSSRGTGKDSTREFMTRAFDEGFMDSVKVKIEDAQITLEGDTATFGPVEFVSDRGAMKLGYTLRKENGTWLIVGSKRWEQ